MIRPRNWAFLGDSLTEGLGSEPATFVTELARQLRASGGRQAIHDIKLREVDPSNFNPYIRTNLAGFLDLDPATQDDTLWIWNLASEGQTIDADVRWLPLLRNLAPERIFIYRGSLDSIIRPAAVRDGHWPFWVPRSWRHFVAMDPRCYFSTTWYRRLKQASVDALKQRVRHRLLAERPGVPLVDADVVLHHYGALLAALAGLGARLHVLGLIPTDERTFPGTAAHFAALNERLRALALESGADFIDWAGSIAARHGGTDWRYRDGFHPNLKGAQMMAAILREHIEAAR